MLIYNVTLLRSAFRNLSIYKSFVHPSIKIFIRLFKIGVSCHKLKVSVPERPVIFINNIFLLVEVFIIKFHFSFTTINLFIKQLIWSINHLLLYIVFTCHEFLLFVNEVLYASVSLKLLLLLLILKSLLYIG